ncbi:MAG: hypothetical protein C5B59_06240 [Bacteroidetes bacterium]|nr:MAG: hypothetical protein C5B59_06240 [Bacteroidota bacterium]
MKQFLLLILITPLFAISQTKNVVSSLRITPKPDKVLEFEKALADHAAKFHKGDFKWRVYMVRSGPDFGSYQCTEGPFSWEELDQRGDLGSEHMADWYRTVLAICTNAGTFSYGLFREDLSTVALTDYSDKISTSHYFPKPGCGPRFEALIKKLNSVWAGSNQTVAVYSSSSSGPTSFTIVTRYKTGWKERAPEFMKPFNARYDAKFGSGSYDAFLAEASQVLDHAWSEMLVYRPDLSSK